MATFRAPIQDDANDLAELMTQLGYPAAPSDMPSRLGKLTSDRDVLVIVAEQDRRVVGVASGHLLHSLHKTDVVAMLTVLAVHERARGMGIGRQLVARIEDWARSHGATTISLTSALRRTEAHAFYRTLGYEHTGLRLVKSLS